ncbi:hypothetical protein RhiirA5_438668 [Rhizophagus irregularis]|uniref:Uncharacterized protein n=1 Tax=Rhizophagus irregularis TaxID=588596 RepID=A0A2N0NIT8_9GLOM|nr:hypothetical protein RhiirA5_438668 [Rhizophagus irregularis]
MNKENSDFNLILNPPNYEKILFGFPYYRKERLLHYKLYVFQQRFFNPDNIPKKKKTSLYQVSLHHLELWIEDSFVQIYDQPCFESLAFAWSRAQHGNIPFLDACNVYFNNNEIQTTPIKTHATLTEISHIGINLYDDKNLPEVWARQSRDKDKKFYKDDIYSLWRWLLESIGKQRQKKRAPPPAPDVSTQNSPPRRNYNHQHVATTPYYRDGSFYDHHAHIRWTTSNYLHSGHWTTLYRDNIGFNNIDLFLILQNSFLKYVFDIR